MSSATIKTEINELLEKINKAARIMVLFPVSYEDQGWRLVIENLTTLEVMMDFDLRMYRYLSVRDREIIIEGRKAARKLWKLLFIDSDSQGLYGWIPLGPAPKSVVTPVLRLYDLGDSS